ncbi:MAG TPA: hypothetical protein VKE96_20970 [Vicinamibacterales bacterium]|nr:hypothetical protein [Vicinamibacterales bacterium]
MPDRPDVVILCVDRLTRVPLRAQLIEDGFEVIGTDSWPVMRTHLRPGRKPSFVIVDLQALDNPEQLLNDVRVLMKPERVIVLTMLGSIDTDELRRRGFVVVRRPVSIGSIVEAARALRARVTTETRSDRER